MNKQSSAERIQEVLLFQSKNRKKSLWWEQNNIDRPLKIVKKINKSIKKTQKNYNGLYPVSQLTGLKTTKLWVKMMVCNTHPPHPTQYWLVNHITENNNTDLITSQPLIWPPRMLKLTGWFNHTNIQYQSTHTIKINTITYWPTKSFSQVTPKFL